MAGMGSVDLKELRELQTKLNRISQSDAEKFCESCAKEIAARLLRKVIKRTPVGDYSDTYDLEDDGENKFLVMSSRKGGTLRRGWTSSGGSDGGTSNVEDFVSGLDSLDWKNYGVDSILTTVLNHKHLGKGSIILCHNGAKYTAKALPKLIDSLKEKGFEFVKMSELIYTKNYEMDTEGRQHSINNTAAPKQTAFEQS